MQNALQCWVQKLLPETLVTKLTPVVLKELRQGLRRGTFLIPFMVIHLFAIGALYMEFFSSVELASNQFTGVMQIGLFFEHTPFWWVVGVICIILMPLGGIVLMQEEMDEGNYELLQMTELSRWQVVLGKLLSIWGITLLTLSSLLPYLIVRYFVGGMDVWRNFALVITVVMASAMVASGAIGASAFKNPFAKIGVFLLYLASMAGSGAIVLYPSALQAGNCGVFYHLNVIAFFLCYVVLGLVIARSRIRLVVHQYEMKPTWMTLVLLIASPMIIGMSSLFTLGYLGGIGCLFVGHIARYTDISPQAPSWQALPKLNTPPTTLPEISNSEPKV